MNDMTFENALMQLEKAVELLESGESIKSIHNARIGDHLSVRVSDGELQCEVLRKQV